MKNKLDEYQLAELIFKELKGELLKNDQEILDAWKAESKDNLATYHKIINEQNLANSISNYASSDTLKAWTRFKDSTRPQNKNKIVTFKHWLQYAAIAIILIGVSTYFLLKQQTPGYAPVTQLQAINSGTQRAVLKTGNNEIIELGVMETKRTIQLASATVSDSNNTLSFAGLEKINTSAPQVMNTLETPRGGEYSLVLSDGTVVYLNTETKLTFPDFFSDYQREVTLSGEAFFEVSKSQTRPFIVKTTNYDVKVYGTSFNVCAYGNDNFSHTTLVEGSVGIETFSGNELKLIPGEQALFRTTTNTIDTREVNTYVYTSWKDGKFVFDHETLEGLTKKLERWYNVDFSFADEKLKTYHFSGTIERYNDLSSILNVVALTTHIEFQINGNSVSVIQKNN